MSEIDPRLAGYSQWQGVDAFEDYTGPYYYKKTDEGYQCAFISEGKHINGQGGLHGGLLMTFADYALFMFARDSLEGIRAVTVAFNAEFTASKGTGEFIEAEGEIVHETRGMLFLRGMITCEGTVLLNFSATLKKLRPKTT